MSRIVDPAFKQLKGCTELRVFRIEVSLFGHAHVFLFDLTPSTRLSCDFVENAGCGVGSGGLRLLSHWRFVHRVQRGSIAMCRAWLVGVANVLLRFLGRQVRSTSHSFLVGQRDISSTNAVIVMRLSLLIKCCVG